jgi:hypothetical protein
MEGAEGLCSTPDQFGLNRYHYRNHDQDFADPTVVADVSEVGNGSQTELCDNQQEK